MGRGVDGSKDQSYPLYDLTQEQLAHTLLPLGGLEKTRTRDLPPHWACAWRRSRTARKSVLCRTMITATSCAPRRPTAAARRNCGCPGYAVGHPRGGGALHHRPAAPHQYRTNEPRYVVALDAAANRVVVGVRKNCCGGRWSRTRWPMANSTPLPCASRVRCWPRCATKCARSRPLPAWRKTACMSPSLRATRHHPRSGAGVLRWRRCGVRGSDEQ